MNVSGSESEDFVPIKKVSTVSPDLVALLSPQQTTTKTKAAPKPAAKPRSAAPTKGKAKAAPKKKVLADHDDNAEESGMDVDGGKDASDDDYHKPSTSEQPAKKKKTASETYQKVCLCA